MYIKVLYDENEVLLNPNCHVGVLHDYIKTMIQDSPNVDLSADYEIDLCDASGALLSLYERPPATNGIETELFTPRASYTVVFLERKEDGTLGKPTPLIPLSTSKNSLLSKLRTNLQAGSRKSDKFDKTRKRSKSIASKTSANTNRLRKDGTGVGLQGKT
ncbi:uncharacterized protein LOC134543140 [Bacillus rossius redtenbacheri]|uniref:uncharacterized protein LOC134543140 n=1 Tax=Bacillus rossius redtenbacheri TaxID=93214 RepID=UPI002FDF016F